MGVAEGLSVPVKGKAIGGLQMERHCADLLSAFVADQPVARAAVLSVEGPDRLSAVTTFGIAPADALDAFGELALQAARSGKEVVAIPDGPSPALRRAIPAALEGNVVALLAVEHPSPQATSIAGPGQPLLLAIALAVDRIRIHSAFDQRAEEIAALSRQLDAYAVDFRSTYAAERERSRELGEALSELASTYRATVRGLAIAVEAKDECTGGHLQRVSRYGMMVTKLVAPEHEADPQFEYGFLLHDIGKLTVPDFILTKAGPLTPDEWEQVRLHPESGRTILEDIPFLVGARDIVHAHHERWDGKGYPRGLAGGEIPLGAQIFPVCDAFDAMTSDRPYRAAMSTESAFGELRRGSGSQFRPEAVDAFLSLPVDELDSIRVASRHTHPAGRTRPT
jgi:HD-GYP domain-containing protein (c-di-GMP phosphodiesterase class II)